MKRVAGDELDALRPRLFGLAYRMLGTRGDAEDAVQEAFLRWHASAPRDVRSPEAWLVTTTTRVALDRLRARTAERDAYVGPWLAEPLVVDRDVDPEARALLADDLSVAFLTLLERLSPEERAAFVLHEAFGRRHAEVAHVLGKSEAATRQLVHRARERVREGRARFVVARDVVARAVARFVEALVAGDEAALLALFAEDATYASDGGGKVAAAVNVIAGRAKIMRLFGALRSRGGWQLRAGSVNGEPAVLAWNRGFPVAVMSVDVMADGRIGAVYSVLNPEKLAAMRDAAP